MADETRFDNDYESILLCESLVVVETAIKVFYQYLGYWMFFNKRRRFLVVM